MREILHYIYTHRNTDFLNVLGAGAFEFVNMGLWLGMAFAVIIVLRPVTNGLLRPRHRVWLWFLGWFSGVYIYSHAFFWKVKLLPVSFFSLVVPRVDNPYSGRPRFLPEVNKIREMDGTIALPGGAEIPVSISDGLVAAAGILYFGAIIAWIVWEIRRGKKLAGAVSTQTKLTREELEELGVERRDVAVYRCKGIEGSYVRTSIGKQERDRGERFVICLQDELPEERLRLVLLHEMAHIELHHPWWKGFNYGILILYAWNPVLWLAYRLTCRDMELDCDEWVVEKLEKEKRRDYAMTLVELATEKPADWGMTCFGECDAALRVNHVARWKPVSQWRQLCSAGFMVLMVLFFFCGSWGIQPGEMTPGKEEWSWDDVGQGMNEHMMGLEWPNYAAGPRLKLDLKEYLGLEELPFRNVWFTDEGTRDLSCPEFWVELEGGVWYHCRAQFQDGDYELTMAEPEATGPDLSQRRWRSVIIYGE